MLIFITQIADKKGIIGGFKKPFPNKFIFKPIILMLQKFWIDISFFFFDLIPHITFLGMEIYSLWPFLNSFFVYSHHCAVCMY